MPGLCCRQAVERRAGRKKWFGKRDVLLRVWAIPDAGLVRRTCWPLPTTSRLNRPGRADMSKGIRDVRVVPDLLAGKPGFADRN